MSGRKAILASANKPVLDPVDVESIPESLKLAHRWVGWNFEYKGTNWTKVPKNALTGHNAQNDNPRTWSSFAEAIAGYVAGRFDGVGFMLMSLPEGDCYSGIDLDDCLNKQTGELNELSREILATISSYAEISPTGTGIKIICLGGLPKGFDQKSADGKVDIFNGRGYFTITGKRVPEASANVEHRRDELFKVWQKFVKRDTHKAAAKSSSQAPRLSAPGVDAAALNVMLRHEPSSEPGFEESDGSRRLILVARVAVEHDLTDECAILTIREYGRAHPFPAQYDDAAILQRVRQAETRNERGSAFNQINVSIEDLAIITPLAWKALQAANKPPKLFRHCGVASRIEEGDQGEPIVKPLDVDKMRYHLAEAAKWLRFKPVKTKGGDKDGAKSDYKDKVEWASTAVVPPYVVVRNVIATPEHPLPVLTRIVEAPVFSPDGVLQTAPGYHPAGEFYYYPAPGFVVPPVPAYPTPQDVTQARELLCDDLLGEFPFVSDSEKAHAVALLLLPFARDLIDGPTPLHLIEKSTQGTGAGLLASVLTYPATGRSLSAMTEGRDEDEWRKRITAKLKSSPTHVLIDNLSKRLDSAALSSALTATTWEDRILGSSDVSRIPVRCAWLANGNNPSLSMEIARRVARIRMDAKMERPWERTGFKHPDLQRWTADNRGELVAAALTLIQAWVVAGKPKGEKTIGSFESWAETMGGILFVAGIKGFLENLTAFYNDSDQESASFKSFLVDWWTNFNNDEKGVKDLRAILDDDFKASLSDSDQGVSIALGKMLAENRGRVFDLGIGRVSLNRGKMKTNAYSWSLALAV